VEEHLVHASPRRELRLRQPPEHAAAQRRARVDRVNPPLLLASRPGGAAALAIVIVAAAAAPAAA